MSQMRRNGGRAIGHKKQFSAAEIEPLKVFVGNLHPMVTSYDLKAEFSVYVNVVRAFTIKDKITKYSKGYGFVEVSQPHEVQKLLDLKYGDKYIRGKPVTIKPARKKTTVRGDDSYVRIPMSDRPYDLEAADPSLPCIHMLVDDVLFKILDNLPVNALIGVERVCRRWQMVVHKLFAKHRKLNLNSKFLGITGPLSRPIISKILILTGPTLKDLKVQQVNFCDRNILRIVSQLCPGLESLDVSHADGINASNLKYLTNGCKNLKSFTAESCIDFEGCALKLLLSEYRELERLNIGGWSYDGRHFNLLPDTLKELKIPFCSRIMSEHLKMIGNRCPNLEILDLDSVHLDRSVIEHIGTHCTKLRELKLCLTSSSHAEALQAFKNLKKLDLEAEDDFQLYLVIEHMTELEDLIVRGGSEFIPQSDRLIFSKLKKLHFVALINFPMVMKSLGTLAKCINLRGVHVRNCAMTSSILLDILRGCPQIEEIYSPDVDLQPDLLTSVNDIMRARTGPLSLSLRADATYLDVSKCQYDSKKIKLDTTTKFGYTLDDYDDFDYDYDDYDDDSIFSGGSFDDEYCWLYGSDLDIRFPDAIFYGDNMGFLEEELAFFHLDSSI